MNSRGGAPGAPEHPAIAQWSRSSTPWSEHAELIATMTRDASDALLAILGPRRGERILDLACGPGDPALRLGRLVAPGGSVVAVDAIGTMIRRTAQRARDGGLRLAAVQSLGERLPFAERAFDRVCCRFGIMFFADPAGALTEVRRVLRHGGRAALAVWGPREHNLYFMATVGVLDALGHPTPELSPAAPTPFEFAEPDALASLVRQTGFWDVREEICPITMRFPGFGPRDLFDIQRRLSPSIGQRVAALDDASLEEVRAGVAEVVEPCVQEGRLELPGEILVVSGVNSLDG